MLVSRIHTYAQHFCVVQSRAFGSYQSVPESQNTQQLEFLAHQEHEPTHRVVLVRYLSLLNNLAPALSISNPENSIKMMDMSFKATDFFVKLSNESVPHVGHDTAEGAEYICLKMHEVYREYFVLFLGGLRIAIILVLVSGVTWRNETSTKPKTVVENSQYFIHTLNVFDTWIKFGIYE